METELGWAHGGKVDDEMTQNRENKVAERPLHRALIQTIDVPVTN